MTLSTFKVSHEYWDSFSLREEDIEFIYTHLLEVEVPLSPAEILVPLIEDRLSREQKAAEEMNAGSGELYLPKNKYEVGDVVVFPALNYQKGKVSKIRDGKSIDQGDFSVMEVEFADVDPREFAAELTEHILNEPPKVDLEDPLMNANGVLAQFNNQLTAELIDVLRGHDDFVYIAGRWFPSALLMDVNAGNLNLAEAVLDMHEGGPMPTSELLPHIGLPEGENPKLAGFSLDLALQDDPRFDEVGSVGEVAWFLKRLEPKEVQEVPIYLKYSPVDYDPNILDEDMHNLMKQIDDEFSEEAGAEIEGSQDVEVNLIFPHWRAGTLPLSSRLARLFPTAYESPRILFTLVDGETGDKFPGWVVRLDKYVFGLREWYLDRGLMPGSTLRLRRGENPGEVLVFADSHQSSKEWVKTALIGADGGIVYATLKQSVKAAFDDRMMIYMPEETTALDQAWTSGKVKNKPFEQLVADTLRNLAKLNPQSNVHAEELYAALNVVFRCPPEPLLALLASRSWFVHVGDLYFRLDDSQN